MTFCALSLWPVRDRLRSEEWKDPGGNSIYAFSWEYDAVGNRTYQYYNGTHTYYSYDAGNQLTQYHRLPDDAHAYYYYDSRGSCTLMQEPSPDDPGVLAPTYFEYNDADLLTRITDGQEVDDRLYYDAQNRRYCFSESTYYVWDSNGNLLEQYPVAYVHGHTPIGGIGSVVASHDTRYDSYNDYRAYDHRGSVIRVTSRDGLLDGEYEYNAWGQSLLSQISSPSLCIWEIYNQQYQSNWFALGGSLYLSPTRIYDAGLGRFLQRDPKRGVYTHNPYEYAVSSPGVFVDPNGREPQSALERKFEWYKWHHPEWWMQEPIRLPGDPPRDPFEAAFERAQWVLDAVLERARRDIEGPAEYVRTLLEAQVRRSERLFEAQSRVVWLNSVGVGLWLERKIELLANRVQHNIEAQSQRVEHRIEALANRVQYNIEAQAQRVEHKIEALANWVESNIGAQAQRVEQRIEAQAQQVQNTLEALERRKELTIERPALRTQRILEAVSARMERLLAGQQAGVERMLDALLQCAQWGLRPMCKNEGDALVRFFNEFLARLDKAELGARARIARAVAREGDLRDMWQRNGATQFELSEMQREWDRQVTRANEYVDLVFDRARTWAKVWRERVWKCTMEGT